MFKRLVRVFALSLVFLGIILGLNPSTSFAHGNNSLAYSEISNKDGVIKYVLQIDMYDLTIDSTGEEIDMDENTKKEFDRFIKESHAPVENYLLSNIQLYADSLPLKGKLTKLSQIEKEGETQPFAEAVLEYPVVNTPKQFALDYNLVFGRDGWHINYVDVAIGDLKKEAVIVSDLHELEVGQMTPQYTLTHFFLLGLIHSFTGFEAILVIVAFIIGIRSIKHFIAVLSVFFGFHALSFILASLQLLTLPNNFVNSIIASSIIVTSLYTLLSKKKKLYLWLAGVVGFFHGFGFAENLTGMRSDSGHPLYSIVSFNAGIDIALIFIAAILYLVHHLIKVERFVPWLLRLLTLFGIVWFIIKALS